MGPVRIRDAGCVLSAGRALRQTFPAPRTLPMDHRIFRILLLCLAGLVAAGYLRSDAAPARREVPPATTPWTSDILLEALQIEAYSASAYSNPLRMSRVRFGSSRSRVVPGLEYHWALYIDPWIVPAGVHYSLAGYRAGLYLPLGSASEWAILTAGWTPSSGREATQACMEMLGSVDESLPNGGPVAWGDARLRDDLLPDEWARVRARARRSRVTVPTDSDPRWRVNAWVLRQGPRRRFSRIICSFPSTTAAQQNGPTVELSDSVPLIQFRVL
jgi:hypothetical protein